MQGEKIESELHTIAAELRIIFGSPKRKSKLPNPLDLLIATILSQNTNDANSHQAYLNLKAVYPDFFSLADVRPKVIEPLIKVGGIANRKSKVIVRVVKQIQVGFPGFRPTLLKRIDRYELTDRLCQLDGVGYKTASCVLLFALGDDDAFPVDTHIHRILNRIGTVKTGTPDKTYLAVRDAITEGIGYELHLNLIKFGRSICMALKPKCYDCPLNARCRWKDKNRQIPASSSRTKSRKVDFMHLKEV